MGEVRVDISLTNAIDEALVRRGQLSLEQVYSENEMLPVREKRTNPWCL